MEELLAMTQPGPEHETLMQLVGTWDVEVRTPPGQPKLRQAGTATAETILGGRFLVIDSKVEGMPGGPATTEYRHTLGFDRRHGVYTVIAMDDSGTYAVAGQGSRDGGRIKMYGEDDDPVMASMGLEKEFVIVLDVTGPEQARIETWFIDTRTPERREMPFLAFRLQRAS